MNDVFPEPIAQVLQEGGRVDDDRTYNAMVFACSITGLDEILAKMSPFQVSRMKERLHNNLLGPAKKHGVFLLETDGNVFMAASNIVEEKPDYDHGMRMVHFAMDACQQTRPRLTTPSKEVIKAGLHFGSVRTGVVGNRNPTIYVFGEDVHVATSMAKHSKLGMINCSREAAEEIERQDNGVMLVKLREDKVFLRCRGNIETFWFLARIQWSSVRSNAFGPINDSRCSVAA